MPDPDPLAAFSPAVREWFAATLGAPTPPQAQGWPPIQRGENTLILAPTGSGKTLTAFLWGIDQILRDIVAGDGAETGVRLLYISPLKALNNDPPSGSWSAPATPRPAPGPRWSSARPTSSSPPPSRCISC